MASSQFKYENKPTLENNVATTRSLLDLSTEVLIEIFAHLPATDMITVQHTCRTIHDIIAGTAYLQYTLRSKINGVDDLLPPDFPYSDRLELLRRHEQSWRDLQFNLFAECHSVSGLPHQKLVTLQDSYLIYQCPPGGGKGLQYGYTDLCTADRNKELRWVHITMGESRHPESTRIIFAVDHDLAMAVSHKQETDHAVLVQLAFFEFLTGAPHPLSTTHTASLPPISGSYGASVHAEVMGDHVLISIWNYSSEAVLYLVSWKTGTVTLLRELPAMTPHNGQSMAVSINSSLVSLIADCENRLEICKLELDPSPRLQTLCLLELPPLTPGTSRFFLGAKKEWVPTSKSYARTRSSRGYHLPFYTSAISTMALRFDYYQRWQLTASYQLIISITALISAIPTDPSNIRWEDWGPPSTHLFESALGRLSVGPFWIIGRPSLAVRQYDLQRTQYTQLMAGETSSLQSRPPIVDSESTKIFQYDIETHLPYRDVMMENEDSYDGDLVANREWVVVIKTLEPEPSITAYHVG